MIPAPSLRGYLTIGAALALALALAWGLRVDHLRAGYKSALETLRGEAHTVVLAVRQASGNDKVEWSNAAGQVIALGESNQALRLSIAAQNERLDELAADAVRAKAEARELKAIADRAEAQRRSALKRLSDLSITPGTRDDCLALLREAEEALDLVREAGA